MEKRTILCRCVLETMGKRIYASFNSRPKWSSVRQNFAMGDIVILVDETTPRNKGPLGRVIKTFTDAKGLVRSVLVKTAHSDLKRPIGKLCLLVPSATA